MSNAVGFSIADRKLLGWTHPDWS